MTLNELTARIVGWAQDRNLIEGSDVKNQCIKLGEELGEAHEAITNMNDAELKDAIGDMYVVATIMAAQLGSSITRAMELPVEQLGMNIETYFGRVCGCVARGKPAEETLRFLGRMVTILEEQCTENEDYTLLDAVAGAWEVIKDRKGRMVDGVFIKEGEDVKTTH